MKTPKEIKKGLVCCLMVGACNDGCPYYNDGCGDDQELKDALAYIQQLERERDAAVADMTELMQLAQFCCYCKYLTNEGECTKDFRSENARKWCWEWRGVEV